MEKFNFLTIKTDRNGTSVMDKYLTLRDLGARFIVRAPLDYNQYYVFPNHKAYQAFLEKTEPNHRCFHEISLKFAAQKFKVDIDASSYKGDKSSFEPILETIKTAVKYGFAVRGGHTIEDTDLVIAESSGLNKISYHIIVTNYCLKNYRETEALSGQVKTCLNLLNPNYHKYIDWGVYKSNQSFRLADCFKEGEKEYRFKRIISGHAMEESFISHTNKCEMMLDFEKDETANASANLDAIDSEEVIKMASEYLEGLEFRNRWGGIISFSRVSPSFCKICDRVHDNDGAYLIINSDTSVVFGCHRSESKKGVLLGRLDPEKKSSKPSKDIQTISDDRRLVRHINTCVTPQLQQLPNTNEYYSKHMSDFELDKDVLLVQAPMKMGKTKKLRELIDYAYPYSTLSKDRIIVISFRQTFSAEFKKKFANEKFILYNSVSGPLTQSRLIVQVESLHRVAITDEPALLILDECESILGQFESEHLGANRSQCWLMFEYLIRCSKKVICMDAHLSQRTVNVVKRIRPDCEPFMHRNLYTNAIDDAVKITTDIGLFLDSMMEDLAAGRNIVVPTNCLKYAKVIKAKLDAEFKNKTIGIFSRETSADIKRTEFADVNKNWKKYDILIYTPTISAGISFEELHYDCIYAMFTDQSCSVEDCMQMLMRVRNLANKTINIYFDCIGNNLPVSIEDIKEHIQASNGILENPPTSLLSYSRKGKRSLELHDTPYLTLYLENQRIINLSKNNFIGIMLGYFKSIGAKIRVMTKPIAQEDISRVIKVHKEFNEYIRTTTDLHCANVANAKDLTSDEIAANETRKIEIEKGNLVPELSASQELSCEKYELQKFYSMTPESINVDFVKTYHGRSVKMRFRELTQIFACDTIKESLEAIRDVEAKKREKGPNKSMYNLHLFCTTFMELSNLDKFPENTRGTYITWSTIMENIRDPGKYKDFIELMRHCCIDLGKRYEPMPAKPPSTFKDIHKLITVVSQITGVFYGLSWRYKKSDDIFSIRFTAKKEFEIGRDCKGSKPHIRIV
jgi:hypothetical protein